MTLVRALRSHAVEIASEAFGLGAFLFSACFFAVLLEHPASPVRAAIPSALERRALMGLAMGLTAILLIYSPPGKRSGAHLNPSVTLAFLRLGRLPLWDAALYVAAQIAGALLGIALARFALGTSRLSAVHFAATNPGPAGLAVAFVAELCISAILMAVVLRIGGSRFARYTGLAAGALVAVYIVVEAPISGMSMNPARSLASALFDRNLSALLLYFVAPPAGMLLATLLPMRRGCAKVVHDARVPCIFCAQRRPPPTKKRVVILGGGFGGVFAAAALERRLGARDDVELVLVSKENYFVFQPMLPEVIGGTIGLLDLVSPLKDLLPRTELHVRDVMAIDLAARTVTTAPGFQPHPHVLRFDHLVLALGNVTDFRGLRGLAEHALPFKNLQDALEVRNRVIRAIEEAAVEDHDPRLREELLTFVVVGGGFSGVEVVAELNDFARRIARRYPAIAPREIRVVLVHSQDRILPEVTEKLGRFAERILRGRGVEILLETRLEAATGSEALLADGRRIPTRTLISTVPSSPHPRIEELPLPKSRGRVEVTPELAVDGHEGLWALGDCALVPAPGGGFAPPTAQHATRQGEVVAHNVLAAIDGGVRRAFTFRGLGKMGSLGSRSAVAEIAGIPVAGLLAWFLWRTIYLFKLPSWVRRAKVAAAWTFDLFLPPELVQFRFDVPPVMRREHFEAGQEVFREGDLGDRVYAILRGSAEVVRGDCAVNRLGPGDLFGEMAIPVERAVRTATVRCIEPLDVWSLPRRDLDLLAHGLPEARGSIERVSAAALRDGRRPAGHSP